MVKDCNFTFFFNISSGCFILQKYNFARKKGDEWRYLRQYMKKDKAVKKKTLINNLKMFVPRWPFFPKISLFWTRRLPDMAFDGFFLMSF